MKTARQYSQVLEIFAAILNQFLESAYSGSSLFSSASMKLRKTCRWHLRLSSVQDSSMNSRQNHAPQIPGLRESAFNVGSGWTHKFVSMLASLFITALAVREYGLDGLGLIILATQVASYAGLVELGIPSSLSRRLPAYLASGDEIRVNAFCSSCLAILMIGALILVFCIPFVVVFLPEAFDFTDEQKEIAGVLFGLAIGFSAVQLPLRMGSGILSSVHKFWYFFVIDSVSAIVKLIAVFIIFTLFSPPLWVCILIFLSPTFVASATVYFIARRSVAFWKFSLRHLSRDSLREMFSLSGAVMIGTLATAIILPGGSIVLAMIVPPAEVMEYALPAVLAFNLIAMSSGLAGFLSPIASQLAGRDENRLRATLLTAIRYTFALAILICLITWTTGPTILRLWLSDEILSWHTLRTMNMILLIAVIGGALSIPGITGRGALVALGKHWTVARIELGVGIAGLVGGLVLGTVLGHAPLMFALAFATAAVAKGVVLLRLLARVLGLPRTAILSITISVAAPLVLSILMLVVTRVGLAFEGLLGVAFEVALVSMTFLGCGLFGVVEKRHRTALFAKISALVS